MRVLISLILLCGICHSILAQEKYERERRISEEDVPAGAVGFLDSCQFNNRVRWHEEESLTGFSVEASIKESGLRYSIEFDTLGQIEDVEIDRRESQVPLTTMAAIHQHLDSSFVRYRIKKIQVQWTGERSALIALVNTGQTNILHTTRYELIVKGCDDTGIHFYEFLFSDNGELLRQSILILRNTDHLDY